MIAVFHLYLMKETPLFIVNFVLQLSMLIAMEENFYMQVKDKINLLSNLLYVNDASILLITTIHQKNMRRSNVDSVMSLKVF